MMKRKHQSDTQSYSYAHLTSTNEFNSFLSTLFSEVDGNINANKTVCSLEVRNSKQISVKDAAKPDISFSTPGVKNQENGSDGSFDVPSVSEDIDDILDHKAEKTNLSVVNVKSILKNVIMNQDVVEMVCKSLQGKEANIPYEPKLTRSRTRELRNKNQPFSTVCALPLTDLSPKPIKSECHLLIDKELSDDSSDEEYMPSDDLQSDDEEDEEHKSSSVSPTNIRKQHKLNKKKHRLKERKKISLNSSEMLLDNSSKNINSFEVESIDKSTKSEKRICDSIKINEDSTDNIETIGHRTRSKLSLSETPLEIIEQQFIPPDITCDMYDWNCDNEDWKNFLKEFTQPLDALPDLNETADDIEADPEYNVLADEEEIADEDKEELRADRAVQVSRKELNDLVKELFEYSEMMSSIENEKKDRDKMRRRNKKQSVKEKSQENEKVEKTIKYCESLETKEVLDFNQRLLLQQQLRQHVQLTTQHYLQTYRHPVLHYLAAELKPHLNELLELGSKNPKSYFKISNLNSAINIIKRWEKLIDEDKHQRIIKFMEKEIEKSDERLERHILRVCSFPPTLMKLISESEAFPYPLLLPPFPFYSYNLPEEFVSSEQQLIILGLNEYLPYIKENRKLFKISPPMSYAAEFLSQYLMPVHTAMKINKYVRGQRASKFQNPIKEYFSTNKLPSIIHYIIPISENTKVKDHPGELLPHVWYDFMSTLKT